jgi:putative transposase
VTNYRRNFICGGSFFFTANLAERRLRFPVDDISSAKDDGFRCRLTHPTVLIRPTVLARTRLVGSVENDPGCVKTRWFM